MNKQTVEYTITMIRPDRKRPVVRRFYDTKRVQAVSRRQIAGFLNHKLFADAERGSAGTFYTIVERGTNLLNVFNVVRDENGQYQDA